MPASLTSNYGFYYGWTLGEDGWNTGNDSNWQSLDNLINTLWNARGLRPVVRAASTANMALTGTAPLTVDGVSLVHHDRVLLKNQTDTRQNGIYEAVFSGSTYTLTRPSDANSQNGLLGCFVWVTEGTQASTGWLQTTKAPITVDATALTWTNVLTAPSATPGTYGSASKTLAVTVASTGAVTGITEYNLSTANVAEATNLYYTDVRARAALSGTSPIGYNSTSGAISIQTASGSQAGALSSTDWSTFNGKEGALGTGTAGQFLKHDKTWGAVDYSVLSGVPSTFAPATHDNTAHSATYITSAGVTYEALNTNSDIGTTSGTVCAGDDSRLSNSRTPTSHATSHQHSGSDEIATATAAANAIPKAGADNKLAIGWVPTGTDANSVCIGNDARLSDARTPTAHTTSHKHGGTDEVATATAAANAIPKSGADNKLAIGWIPTGNDANSVCIGNDARLSDARTPTSHVHAGSDITSSTVGTTYGGTGLSTIGTANQVLGSNAAGNGLEYKTISGTSNRVTVTHAANSVTLSAPQDIHTSATPQFAGLAIGTTSPATDLHVATTITSSPRGIMSSQHSAGTDGARFHGRKSRGTNDSPTVISTGDMLMRLVGSGYDGSNYLEMAAIDFVSVGTVASTRVPTEIRFSTATDAAPSVLTERMAIDKAGMVSLKAAGTAQIAMFISNSDTTAGRYSDLRFGHPTAASSGIRGYAVNLGADNKSQLRFYTSPSANTPTERMTINEAGQVSILTNTASTSTASGSLVNAGGFGNAGDIFNGGHINLASGKVYKVNAVQVVGAQGAAVADATGAGDVVAQLNALLARLRAHGLIAT